MIGNRCAVCGLDNPLRAAACAACGEPLLSVGMDDLPESLPPLPDGGLAQSMPGWLRDAPAVPPDPHDPATFLTVDDLPAWLRAMGEAPPSAAPATEPEAAPPPRPEPLYLPTAPANDASGATVGPAAPRSGAPVAPPAEPELPRVPRERMDSGTAAGIATALILFLVLALVIAVAGVLGR
jgi:hypothetical protein